VAQTIAHARKQISIGPCGSIQHPKEPFCHVEATSLQCRCIILNTNRADAHEGKRACEWAREDTTAG
jgi:hypothetical protein